MIDYGEDIDIVTLRLFDAAFPVAPEDEDEMLRRFATLFSHESRRQRGSSATVARVTNLYGETFALKRLHIAASDANPKGDRAESRREEPDSKHKGLGSDGGTVKTLGEPAAPRTSDEKTPRFYSSSGSSTSSTPDYVTQGHVAALYEEYRIHQALSRLRGFPKLYGFGFYGNDPVIIMEWVEGETLHAVMKRRGDEGPLPLQTIAELGIAVLSRLGAAAELSDRFVHRDLSPRNIILRTDRMGADTQLESGEFDICLIDFGSSSLEAVDSQDPTFTSLRDIWRMGTPAYAPPEMLTADIALPAGWRHSQAIDTYALCSILYELYTGRRPYRFSSSSGMTPYRVKTETAPDAIDPRPPDGGALASIIETGLSPQQVDRPSVAQLKAALENWKRLPSQRRIGSLRGVKPTDASFWQPEYARKAITRRAALAAGIVAAGALVAGAIIARKPAAPADPFDPSRYTTTADCYDGPPLFKAFDGRHPGWMLCNEAGEIICKPNSSRECGALREGLVALYDDVSQRYGFITPCNNADGYAWFVLPGFAGLGDFSEGLAAAQDLATKLWGFIDMSGSWAVAPQFLAVKPFSNGCAAVQAVGESARWGAIDTSGKWVVEPAFAALGTRSARGFAIAQAYGPTGETTGNENVNGLEPEHEGQAASMPDKTASNASNSAKGDRPSALQEDNSSHGSGYSRNDADNAAKELGSNLWGIVDANGEWACEPAFPQLRSCQHGPAPARDATSGLWGFVAENGHFAIPPAFRDARPFYPAGDSANPSLALAAVQDAETQLWYFIGPDGTANQNGEPRFWKLGDLHNGLAPAQASAHESSIEVNPGDPTTRVRGIGMRYGYVDAAGEWHLRPLTTLTDTGIGVPEL